MKNSEEIIKNEYCTYWLNDILQVLAKLNYISSFTQYNKTTTEEIQLMKPFLSDHALSIFLHSNEVVKLVTHQQILANIRLAFLFASTQDTGKKVFGNEKEFGKLIYRVTDFLEGYIKFLDEKHPTDEERKRLYMTMARNMFFNERSTFVLSLSRLWYIFNRVSLLKENRKFKIKLLFSEATGTDYNYLLAVGFAVWGFYSKPNKAERLSKPEEFLFNDNYFKNTKPRARAKLSKALNLLSGDYSFYIDAFKSQKEHEGKHFFLNPFWKKPIIKTEVGAYFMLDTNYLERRLGDFWYIFDKAKDNKERMSLKDRWGRLFESYVNIVAKKTFPVITKRVFSEIDKEQNSGVDLIIYYPDTLIFIEITTKQVRYEHWVESNYSEIEKALKRILIQDTNSKGRAVKLQEAINKVRKGEIALEGVDLTKVKNYIPIVLFENSPPMHNRLWQFYDSILQENGIKDRHFLDDLDFWDIEEFEILMADVEKGKA